MRVLVQSQVGRMREAPSAFAADVWPLTRVYPHVLPQVGGLSEGFITHLACVRLETKMNILVSPQAARVLKSLGASVAQVRALPGVLAQVILVVGTPLESQGAIGTHKGTNSCVDALMDLEKRRAFEGFTTVLAFIRLFP